TLASRAGERVLPVDSFITGYRKSALSAGGGIPPIRPPFLPGGGGFVGSKSCKRFGQGILTGLGPLPPARPGGGRGRGPAGCGGFMAAGRRARWGPEVSKGR